MITIAILLTNNSKINVEAVHKHYLYGICRHVHFIPWHIHHWPWECHFFTDKSFPFVPLMLAFWRASIKLLCNPVRGWSSVWSPEIIAWRDVVSKRARIFVSHAHLRFLNVCSWFGYWRRAGCLQKRRDERFPDSRRSGLGNLDYSWTPRSVLVSHRRRPRRRFLPRHRRPLTAGASNLGDLSRSLSINKSIHG